MKLLLCDIDGTLLVVHGIGRTVMNEVFSARYGIDNAWGDLLPDGMTDPIIVELVIKRTLGREPCVGEVEEILKCYESLYPELVPSSDISVFSGATTLCEELSKRASVGLGIQTGNIEPVAWMKLRSAALAEYFSFGGFSSDSKLRSEIVRRSYERGQLLHGAVSPQDVVVLGDAVADMAAAKANGFRAVGVSTGRTSAEALSAAGAHVVLKNLVDTELVLQALGID